MYEFDGRIRYSEVDSDGQLTWLALMDYFQDCSVFHSEQENLSVEYLKEHHIAWVLTFWQICKNRMPHLAEPVTTQTWPYEMKSFYGYRNFVMRDGAGEMLAYANSIWVLVDTETGRPIPVPQEIGERYGLEPPLPMKNCPRKIVLPESYEKRDAICVPSYFIDTNHHMNNSHYVEVALGYVPESFAIAEVRVEYRKEAKEGDVLYPCVSMTEEGMVTALCDEAGKPYAVIVFIKK